MSDPNTPAGTGLTHIDADGRARMVDVSGKAVTTREATARGRIVMRAETLALALSGGGKKGVIKDAGAHAAAVERVRDWLEALGWTIQATTESPITGGDGNVEFLLWAKKPG